MIAAGQSIGSYRILNKIGTGGMGAVYLAEHPLIGKKVALKVIHRDLANNREIVQRFFQEAQAVTRIGSEHIVSIHDFGQTPEGDHFYIMEYLEGRTLAQVLSTDRVLPVMRALHIGAQIASALASAHAAGVIHRDLKPDNIMLTQRLGDPDFVVLLDFGLAKMFAGGGQSAVKTAAGVLLGTPQYMSPEACESRPNLDHRTDVYALGILLFQMMTGVLPFDGESMGEVLVKQVTQLPPPPRGFNPNIPPAVEQVILRSLAKNPDVRFPTMQALREALLDPEVYLHASPPVAPARSLAPGEAKVDAAMVMAYAAAQQAAKQGTRPMALVANGSAQMTNASARTMIADGGLVPPRISGQAPSVGQAPDLVSPAMPKMNTMRIATPVGYVSRPPRRMWPIVLVVALLLGVGGGAFAVAWYKRSRAAAQAGSGTAPATGSGTKVTMTAGAGSAKSPTPDTGAGSSVAGTTTTSVGSAAAGSASAGSAATGTGSAAGSATTATQTPPSTGTTSTPIAPRLAVVMIESTPPGAEVFGPDKKSAGKTPLKLELPISDLPLDFELRLGGYRRKTRQLIVSGSTVVQVSLEKAPATAPAGTGKGTGGTQTHKNTGDGLERPD